MAVSDIESVLDFLRKNGLAEAESALRDDVFERRGDLSCFDFEKFEFPMSPPRPSPLRIVVGNGRSEIGDDVDVDGLDSSSDSSDDFVSMGSGFFNPYGLPSINCVKSEASSDGDFGTARDYHDSDILNDMNWYDEKDRGHSQYRSFTGTDFLSCPSEDKFVTTLDEDKQIKETSHLNFASEGFHSVTSINCLEKSVILNKASMDEVDDALVKDFHRWNGLQPEQRMEVHGRKCHHSGLFCEFCFGSQEIHIEEYEDSKQMKILKEPYNFQSQLKDADDIFSDYERTWDTKMCGASDIHGNEFCKESEYLRVSENSIPPNVDNDSEIGDDRERDEEEHDAGAAREGEEPSSANELLMFDNCEDEYEIFNLRVIHRKNRTGFEENKDFPIVLNTVIAGRYYVMEYLGSAAFSKVVQAHDLQTGIDVCLKIIKNDKDFFDQSLDEIKLLKFVNKHDPADEHHILRLYDYFYHQEHLFIVCELLRANLYEFQKYNQDSGGEVYFSLRRLQIIARQCLEALEFLHHLGIIHCDLKPENILIKSYSRCEIKVIDLGSSCFQTDNLCLYVQSRSYRAPEVILGLPYDQKIDIWSLGCILAELCSGDVLFPNDGLVMLLARVIAMLGPIDMEMLEKGQETDKYFTKEYDLYYLNEETNQLEYIIPEESSLEQQLHFPDTGFIEFVKSLLEVNPSRRPTASEALQHPWLSHLYG